MTLLALGACTRADETTPLAAPQPQAARTAQADVPTAQSHAKVGLLLPLTGRAAAVGQDMQDAAQMALFDAQSDLQLLTEDTGDSPEQALRATQTALDQGASLILGPLFGNSARNIAPAAAGRGINVITFSNDATVARPGLFVLGFRPEEQVERIVRFAHDNGAKRVALLAPDDAYGNLATAAFRRTMATLDPSGTSSQTILYPADGDASAALQTAATSGVPFDAILIADGGQRLVQVAAQIKSGPNAATRLLGTRRVEEDSSILSAAPLQGAWIAGMAPDAVQSFMNRFATVYGHQPNELAVLSYDAVGLAALLARSNTGFAASAITDPQGFYGVLSPFRLKPDGTSEHNLAILQVDQGKLSVLAPAAQSFQSDVPTN
ncbi:penicillin-binding protein activator [Arboricoccus pini]|uniref:penicillin-binding protein activator n=1 Tax=Arboricoccus pini TaxID=1963835 RepID=UPI001FAFE280|nr:penicillin-binding protein activator [Arboricoccus pini]